MTSTGGADPIRCYVHPTNSHKTDHLFATNPEHQPQLSHTTSSLDDALRSTDRSTRTPIRHPSRHVHVRSSARERTRYSSGTGAQEGFEAWLGLHDADTFQSLVVLRIQRSHPKTSLEFREPGQRKESD